MRYFRLWLSFFKVSWMADMEYRLNISVRVFGEFAWYAVQLSVFEVLYTHTHLISGWDVNAMRVFMGTLFLVDVLYMISFHENMENLTAMVKRGDLDLYLTKPVDSQFMVSCRKISVTYFINLFFVLAYVSWAVSRLPNEVSVYQVASYIMLVMTGFVVLYSIRFMFGTLAIFLQDAGNIQFVWHQLYRLGTRPDPIYPVYMRWFVLTLFPVAFFASVPARILVEGVSLALLCASTALAAGLLLFSHLFWNKALRSYSSASS